MIHWSEIGGLCSESRSEGPKKNPEPAADHVAAVLKSADFIHSSAFARTS
jgi:hypothetical protein